MTRIGSSELDIFPVVFGGNVFGWTADAVTSHALLDAFVGGGGTLIDTADGYSHWVPGNTGGESETIIGSWLAARRCRDQVLIATKVSTHPQYKGLSPANINRAVDASLARLGTDHIDLYYAHYDDPSVPLAETLGALSALVDAGKVRYLGVSNYTAARIDEWFAATAADNLHRAVALQPQYNLVERDFEANGLRDAAERYGLGVLTYYSLASGFLTGKYRPGREVGGDRAERAATYLTPQGERVLAALDEVAGAHGVEPATVALAWLRTQPTVVAPIASVSRLEQMPALLAAATLDLTADEVAALTAA
ncbi:MAG: aldo/keto reductase [Propionibacteriaceae bacterium]|jgi:aryl-alcohol dehydrogenase-like predicted oxidoreductase|nr:aldo/keto reductase [Propionibacteriaceae bacterium]